MLEAFSPLSLVPLAIGPHEDTFTMLVVVMVLSDILAAVWPSENAHTIHFVIRPCTLIHASI